MQHQCQDPNCGHSFFVPGQSEDSISPAAQCPKCQGYRTRPISNNEEANDFVHGIGAMPDSHQDDMSGNPLQEGFLGDWKNRDVRDESFAASVRKRGDFPSLFESMGPEFETTQIVAPPDLYRHGLEAEAAHQATLQLPKGITDNLHAALGNLRAWVENPSEDGRLRPYADRYWKVIRPAFSSPGSLRIGVADPTMAEIINHVAQTDDLSPLYEYRGKTSHTRTAGPLAGLIPEGVAALFGGGGLADAAGAGLASGVGEAGGAAGLAAGGDAAATAGATEQAASAGGVGGLVNRVAPALGDAVKKGVPLGGAMEVGKGIMAPVVGMGDDLLGVGAGGGSGTSPAGGPANDIGYYARTAGDENDAFPDSHDEVAKQEDGDYKEKDDGNSHEWQRDISVNDVGGTDHAPSFDPAGPGFQRFVSLIPLLLQYLESGEDGSQDPLIQGLHDSLEAEIPGYRDHADDDAAQRLIMILSPGKSGGLGNEPDHTDENSGGAHHSKVASLTGEAAEFLPDFTVTPPYLRTLSTWVTPPAEGERMIDNPEEILESKRWPRGGAEHCPYCGHYGPTALGLCGGCRREIYDHPQAQETALQHGARKMADTIGPQTPEQVLAVQKFLRDQGADMDTILSVPENPELFAQILAKIQQSEPPSPPSDGGLSANPPMPAQEAAPPGATMPMPGMEQQMMGAVQRYSADNVATVCPECGSHTTGLLNEDGDSVCHACGESFKTEGKTPDNINHQTSSWHVSAPDTHTFDLGGGSDDDDDLTQGVPAADQHHQEDSRLEQDSAHSWLDESGNPLKVGEQYEMYSDKYQIPDLVRIEGIKPDAIEYTITGQFGVDHTTELDKQEANIERIRFDHLDSLDNEVGFDDPDSLEFNNDDNTAYTGSPERTDVSAPSGLVAASVNPRLSWLMEGVPRTAGANYTPMEQRTLIEEKGLARNADMLSLEGTHYIEDADDDQFLFGV